MSVSSYNTLITAVLSDNGYRQIPENRIVDEVSMANNHLSYSLKWIGTHGLVYLSSDKMMYSNVFMLEIKYKGINSLDREANAELFVTLLEALTEISGFMGFAEDGVLEDIDNKHTKATLKIIIGAENTC